ncbi:PASTA domain-containing protein [Streptomyces cyaneofuscatus]|uniref:PASTA domain-containing protein n=1 Tax=Streptomyces cyaneofuscatus TaxID=66883 RepID=UPI00341EF30E
MRIPRPLAPLALLGVLALAGCGGGTPSDDSAPATAPATTATATASATPTVAPTPTPTPDPVMPALHSKTYEDARAEFTRQDISPARLTTAAQHKDVVLPRDHDAWHICATSPRPGATLTAGTEVTVRLAEDFSDCTTSFHGYLHQKNDPAYTPPAPKPKPTAAPRTAEPQAPAPAPKRTATQPAAGGGSMITCPDGKQGYACTSNGHPVVDGQFCPKADRGRTLKATNGTTVTCSYDPSITPYRWQ